METTIAGLPGTCLRGMFALLLDRDPSACGKWYKSLIESVEGDMLPLLVADCLAFIFCINPHNILKSLLPLAPQYKATDALGTIKVFAFIKEHTEKGSYEMYQRS